MSTTTPGERRQPPKKKDLKTVLSSRGGSAVIAMATALLAGAVLLVFLNNYRKSVDGDTKTTSVLVAQRLIEKGSSGDVIATEGLYQTARLRRGELKDGALADPALVRGKVAAADILPGQQLTAKDFKKAGNEVTNRLAGDERAVTIPLDSAHGMIGDIKTGDRVDVIVGFNVELQNTARATPVARVLLQNVLVLKAPPADGGGVSTGRGSVKNVVLQVPTEKIVHLTFSSDNGKLWLVNRPKAGAEQGDTGVINTDTVMFDSKPIKLSRWRRDVEAAQERTYERAIGGAGR